MTEKEIKKTRNYVEQLNHRAIESRTFIDVSREDPCWTALSPAERVAKIMERRVSTEGYCDNNVPDITKDDIKWASQYLMDNIHCMDVESTCGTYIGCLECPFEQFRQTVLLAFRKLSDEMW